MEPWKLVQVGPDWWTLQNTSRGVAAGVTVYFRKRDDAGVPLWETVGLRPSVLHAGDVTRIRIRGSDTVDEVTVEWRAGFLLLGRRRWDTSIAGTRLAVLPVDRSTALPVPYEYDRAAACFRTIGYLRMGGLMVPRVEHEGPETAAGRDEFLRTVLRAFAVPEKQARRIVLRAEHGP